MMNERQQAFLEAAEMLNSLTIARIQLAAGEMTAQEKRAVLAVLRWQARVLEDKARETSQPADGLTPLPKVTRVNVVDGTGLRSEDRDVRDVSISIQDDGQTLKVFFKSAWQAGYMCGSAGQPGDDEQANASGNAHQWWRGWKQGSMDWFRNDWFSRGTR